MAALSGWALQAFSAVLLCLLLPPLRLLLLVRRYCCCCCGCGGCFAAVAAVPRLQVSAAAAERSPAVPPTRGQVDTGGRGVVALCGPTSRGAIVMGSADGSISLLDARTCVWWRRQAWGERGQRARWPAL